MNNAGSNPKMGTGPERENWGSRFGALMAMAGMAIGLGNVWRFPYMIGENGGGAFVFAYMIILMVIVIPLAIVEMGMGKGIGLGNIDTFGKALGSRKAGILVGGGAALVYLSMNFFFLAIIGISLYFIYASAIGLWTTITPDQIYDQLMANKVLLVTLFAVICAAVSAVTYKGVTNGIEKASKIMVPAIFICFGVLIVYSWTLPGISSGYEYLLAPDWGQLKSTDLWIAAAGQALFSVGVGPGCILVYGSHLKKKDDVTLNALTMSLLDTSVALVAALAMIPACIAMGLSPEGGSGLIFKILPTIFSRIPGGSILGILVFAAIFFAGITSAVAQLEVPTTTFMDAFGWSRKKAVTIFTVITIAVAVPAVYSTELLDFWNAFAGYGFVVFAGVGGIAFSGIYGVKKIRNEFINPTSDIKIGAWFDILVKFIGIPAMAYIVIISLI